MTFVEDLRRENQRYEALASKSQVTILPGFLDLIWGVPVDPVALFDDPPLQFDTQERRLVLLRLHDEIRYYAGSSNPYDENLKHEIGIFPNIITALEFGHFYLIDRFAFSEIKIDRCIRWSS